MLDFRIIKIGKRAHQLSLPPTHPNTHSDRQTEPPSTTSSIQHQFRDSIIFNLIFLFFFLLSTPTYEKKIKQTYENRFSLILAHQFETKKKSSTLCKNLPDHLPRITPPHAQVSAGWWCTSATAQISPAAAAASPAKSFLNGSLQRW